MSEDIKVRAAHQEKQIVVDEVLAEVSKSQTLVMAEYRGVTVADMTKLRKQARGQGVYLRVLKNTLARRAVQGSSFEVATPHMAGPLIYGFSADAVAAAKVMSDFAKGNDKLALKAGVYNGRALDLAGVQALANIPSRDTLLSQLLFVMQAPVSGMARALAAVAAQKAGPVVEAVVEEAVAEMAAEVVVETAAEAPAA